MVLVLLIAMGDVGPRRAAVLGALLLAAGYAQFFGGSMLVVLAGLGGQTVLAIYLLVRWQLTS